MAEEQGIHVIAGPDLGNNFHARPPEGHIGSYSRKALIGPADGSGNTVCQRIVPATVFPLSFAGNEKVNCQ
jgi:hypothetical protein